MIRTIARRIVIMIFLLAGISLISFLIMQLAPGSYLDTLALNPQISPSTIAHMREKFGLNLPWYVQYFRWMKGILPHPVGDWRHWSALDFGISFATQIPVFDILKPAMVNTFVLAAASVIVSWVIAIPIGVIASVKQNGPVDQASVFAAYVGFAIPDFFFALVLLVFAARATWLHLPIGGMRGPDAEFLSAWGRFLDLTRHLVLPTLVLSIGNVAYLVRQMRASMLDVLRAEFVTTARAKGASEARVVGKHAFRNALNPMITLFGFELGFLLSGALAVEIVMSWPGLGRVIYEAVMQKDLYVVMGDLMLSSFLLVVGNLIADVLLVWSDPRIKYG